MSDEEWSDEYMYVEESQIISKLDYEILTETDIQRRQNQAINRLIEDIGLDHTQATVLLIQNSWIPQKVLDGIMNSSITLPVYDSQSSKPFERSLSVHCLMCYKSKRGCDMIASICNHPFCINCYSEYLTETVSSGEKCITAKCPMPNCGVAISEDLFKRLLSRKLFERYRMFVVRSFVDCDSDMKWCPALNCNCAVKNPQKTFRDIVCNCGYSWCFSCARESHRPLSCELFVKWNERIKVDDSDKWLLANTKSCPKCKNAIQKNEGCMHMTCKCGYEFCWLCSKEWHKHCENGYQCNRFTFDEKPRVTEEKNRVLAAYSLKRFEHYYDRFITHQSSLKQALEKKAKAEADVAIMYERIKESFLFDFFNDAVDLIYNAKRSLAYSYALGYFLESPCKVQFYEFIQGSLESSMIQLDEATNENLLAFIDFANNNYCLSLEFSNYRMYVMNLAEVVRNYFSECIKQMEAGFPEIKIRNEEKKSEEQLLKMSGSSFSSKWICGVCTYYNDVTATVCVACQRQKIK